MRQDIHLRLAKLAFDLDALVGKGRVVDAAFGPAKDVKPAEFKSISNVAAALGELQTEIHREIKKKPTAELDDLLATAQALRVFARAPFPARPKDYLKTLESMYGVPFSLVGARRLGALRNELQKGLAERGFKGKWPQPLIDWRKDAEVDAKTYLQLLHGYVREFKRPAYENIIAPILGRKQAGALSKKTQVELELLKVKASWSAYHYYLGGYKSRIEVAMAPHFSRDDAAVFIAHEVYPGHHTQIVMLQHLLDQKKIGPLYGLSLLNTPGSLIAEGIAVNTLEILAPKDPELRLAALKERFRMAVRHEIGLRYILKKISADEACEALQQELGSPRAEAERSLRFTNEWLYYFPCYGQGLELVGDLWHRHGFEGLKSAYLSVSLQGCWRRCP